MQKKSVKLNVGMFQGLLYALWPGWKKNQGRVEEKKFLSLEGVYNWIMRSELRSLQHTYILAPDHRQICAVIIEVFAKKEV